MNITVISCGNSGLAMAAHLGLNGQRVTLWNRTQENIRQLIQTKIIHCEGAINASVKIDCVTSDLQKALENVDIIFITAPANAHKQLAKNIALSLKRKAIIVLNPGRTFGAIEFYDVFRKHNNLINPIVFETQTIIYTCRKIALDKVDIIAFKNDVKISCLNKEKGNDVFEELPQCVKEHLQLVDSYIYTSLGNVGMTLHCAPLLFNIGWTESNVCDYKHYYDGISPSISNFIEKIDEERIAVAKIMGFEIETLLDWLKRNYNVNYDSIYECIQHNESYKNIYAPKSLQHRYFFEDIPCGLVPLEYLGLDFGIEMKYTKSVIDMASLLLDYDFRDKGRKYTVTQLLEAGDGKY